MSGSKYSVGDVVKIGDQIGTVTRITNDILNPYMVENLLTKAEFPFSEWQIQIATKEDIDEFNSRPRPKFKMGDKVIVKTLDAANKNGEIAQPPNAAQKIWDQDSMSMITTVLYVVRLEHNNNTFVFKEQDLAER